MPLQFPQLASAYGNLGASTVAGGLAGLTGKFLDTFVTDEAKNSKNYYDRAFNKALEMKKAGLNDNLINQYLKSAIDAPAANIMKQEAPFLNMLGVNTVQEPDYLPALRASLTAPTAVPTIPTPDPNSPTTRVNNYIASVPQADLTKAREKALATIKPKNKLGDFDFDNGKNKALASQLDAPWQTELRNRAAQMEADPERQLDSQLAQINQNYQALNRKVNTPSQGIFQTDNSGAVKMMTELQNQAKAVVDMKKTIQELKFLPTDKLLATYGPMADSNPSVVPFLNWIAIQRGVPPEVLQNIKDSSVQAQRLGLDFAKYNNIELPNAGAYRANIGSEIQRRGVQNISDFNTLWSGGVDGKELKKIPGQVRKEAEQSYNAARTNQEQIYRQNDSFKLLPPADQNKFLDFVTIQQLNGASPVAGYNNKFSDPVTFWQSPEGQDFAKSFDYKRAKDTYINRETERRTNELGGAGVNRSILTDPLGQQMMQQYLGIQAPGQLQAQGGSTWDGLITQYSNQYGVPPEIMKSILNQESGGNPKAVGDGGKSKGAWQINDVHKVPDAIRFDPAKSTEWAAQFLANLYKQTGSWEKAVERYNGSGPEARKYSQTVMARAKQYGYGSVNSASSNPSTSYGDTISTYLRR